MRGNTRYTSSPFTHCVPTDHTTNAPSQWIVLSPKYPHLNSKTSQDLIFVSPRRFVPVIGLVGGVGSGKSALAHLLSAKRNVVIIDGDEIGHLVLNDRCVKDQIRLRFGATVFDTQGEVNRTALGHKVFGSSTEKQQARANLESIVHSRIREGIVERIADARTCGDVEAIILDAAILLEAVWNDLCNAVVFVAATRQKRLERVQENRGWNLEKLKAREASQSPLKSKRNASDNIVDNSGALQEAATQLGEILDQIIHDHR